MDIGMVCVGKDKNKTPIFKVFVQNKDQDISLPILVLIASVTKLFNEVWVSMARSAAFWCNEGGIRTLKLPLNGFSGVLPSSLHYVT